MRHSFWIVVMAVLAGCASPKATVVSNVPSAPALTAQTERKAVETRYEVRGYREAANPAIRHEAHAVYRRTLVPDNATTSDTVPRMGFAPASVAPLPASDELNAELAKQKAITAEMQTMQASMADIQTKMQAQYSQLVKQTGEALRLRQRLEAERSQGSGTATAADGVAAAGDPRATAAKW